LYLLTGAGGTAAGAVVAVVAAVDVFEEGVLRVPDAPVRVGRNQILADAAPADINITTNVPTARQALFREHSGNIQGAFSCTQGTFSQHHHSTSRDIQRTFRKHSGNIQSHLGNIQSTPTQHVEVDARKAPMFVGSVNYSSGLVGRMVSRLVAAVILKRCQTTVNSWLQWKQRIFIMNRYLSIS
jgi:hypothetical protein